jgi:DUF2934 family protein
METPTSRPKRDRRTQPRISPTEIAHRAYELYMQRGGEHGHDVDDWLQAERELRKATSLPTHDEVRPHGGTDHPHPHPTKADLRSDKRAKKAS